MKRLVCLVLFALGLWCAVAPAQRVTGRLLAPSGIPASR
jgi:hypothetical protein